MRRIALALTLGLAAAWAAPLAAQQSGDDAIAEFERSLSYQQGTVTLGDGLATMDVPAEFRFLGPEDAKRLIEDGWGNPPDDAPLGMLVPAAVSPLSVEGWGVIVTFEEDGYVEDDDAGSIDYAELLEEMQADTRAANAEREEAGYPAIELVGWAAPPHYDAAAHKLYWAKELEFGGDPEHTLNYNIRVLGRRGVLVFNAVAGMGQLAAVEADMQSVLGFVEFNEGHRYADFLPGTDKVAAYGIAGLIAGKVAAKAGLFKLLLGALVAGKKLVAVGVVAVVAFLRRLLGRGRAKPETAA